MHDIATARHWLRSCFEAGITEVEGGYCVQRYLRKFPLHGAAYLIAIGKAAEQMAVGAYRALNGVINAGLVITKQGCGYIDRPEVQVLSSGHPLPDARSLHAGDELISFIEGLPPHAPVLILLSGGASALVEVLPDDLDVEQLAQINQWLLGSGLAIAEMNAVRKRLSCIKGGRLAEKLLGHSVTCLAISDVQGDDPGVIGSGLLVADTKLQQSLNFSVPAFIQQAMRKAPMAPPPSAECFAQVQFHIIASLRQAMRAAAEHARGYGLPVIVHEDFVCGDALRQGERLANQLITAYPGIHVWGGETTVRLPQKPGRGGRNQSLALSAALVLRDHNDIVLLAAGTDGNDGPGDDAGAIVDGGTIRRGEQAIRRRAQECLTQADAGSLLWASGDLFQTGTTGTNVMDLIIGIKLAS